MSLAVDGKSPDVAEEEMGIDALRTGDGEESKEIEGPQAQQNDVLTANDVWRMAKDGTPNAWFVDAMRNQDGQQECLAVDAKSERFAEKFLWKERSKRGVPHDIDEPLKPTMAKKMRVHNMPILDIFCHRDTK